MATRSGQRNLSKADGSACLQQFVSLPRLCALGHNVFAFFD
jgi:hypothetical protein